MAVERDELRTQLPDLFHKGADQLGLGALSYVGCAERVNAPALRLAARDNRADAYDLVERVLWEARPKCLAKSASDASPMSSIRPPLRGRGRSPGPKR